MDTAGMTAEDAANNPAIPEELRAEVMARLDQERVLVIRDPNVVQDPHRDHFDWLHLIDRASWYFWPRQREYLIDRKGWPEVVVRSIDRTTDLILASLENPLREDGFRTHGLVVGYVQSGKTANYTALIAKAADCGYRLVSLVLASLNHAHRERLHSAGGFREYHR